MIVVILLAFMISMLSFFCGFIALENNSRVWIDVFFRIGWCGFSFLSLAAALYICSLALVRLAAFFNRRTIRSAPSSAAAKSLPPNPGRRGFIRLSINMGIAAASGSLTALGFAEAERPPELRKLQIPVKKQPSDLKGFRIVQITDLHIDRTIKREWVQSVADRVNALSPDLIVLTGDLADDFVPIIRPVVEPLAHTSAVYGKFFVTGNHEYIRTPLEWIEAVKKLGFTVLLNEHRILRRGNARVLVAGVPDVYAPYVIPEHISSPRAALRGAPQADYKILLAHQPQSIYEAAEAGYDLQISGHTHGGQFLPWGLVILLTQPFLAGRHRYKNTDIYVSCGTGYWGPPIRLGSRSEITLIELT